VVAHLVLLFLTAKRFLVIELNLFKLGLGSHLFVKVSRPGVSGGTFSVLEPSCHLLLPV